MYQPLRIFRIIKYLRTRLLFKTISLRTIFISAAIFRRSRVDPALVSTNVKTCDIWKKMSVRKCHVSNNSSIFSLSWRNLLTVWTARNRKIEISRTYANISNFYYALHEQFLSIDLPFPFQRCLRWRKWPCTPWKLLLFINAERAMPSELAFWFSSTWYLWCLTVFSHGHTSRGASSRDDDEEKGKEEATGSCSCTIVAHGARLI